MTSAPRPCREALHLRHEIRRSVVDGRLRAQRHARGAFVVRAGRRDHPRAERARQHDRRGADAGRAAMHQKRLAGREAPPIEHVGPDREEGFGDRAGFEIGHAGRDGQHAIAMRGAEARIAAARHEGAYAVADLPAPTLVRDRDHGARHFQPWDVRRRAGRRRVSALPLQNVRPVHARGGHPDEHFAGLQRRHRPPLRFQHLRAARRAHHDRGHLFGKLHAVLLSGTVRYRSGSPLAVE